MTIIVETGSGTNNANSYISDPDLVSHAESRGLSIPILKTDREKLIILSMDYLDGLGLGVNTIDWNQAGSKVCCVEKKEAFRRLKSAQAWLCTYRHSGADFFATPASGQVIEETVGPITTKYSDGTQIASSSLARFPAVKNLLDEMLRCCGNNVNRGAGARVVRV